MQKPLTILNLCSAVNLERRGLACLRQARALQLRGHRVLVACRPGTPLEERARKLNLQVFTDMVFPSDFPRRHLWQECRLMARRIDIEIVEVVHTHGAPESWVASVGARLAARHPAVLRTEHDQIPEGREAFKKLIQQGMIDHLVVPLDHLYRKLRSCPDFDARQASLVYNGVDLKRFSPSVDGRKIRAAFNIPEEAPLALLATRMTDEKGQQLFLKALAEVRKRLPAARGLWACTEDDDNLEHTFLALAEQQGLGRETIGYAQRHKDMETLLAATDLVVIPGADPFHASQVTLQAMAIGRPVLASRDAGVAAYIEEQVTGGLVEGGNAELLAQAMLALLSNRALAKEQGMSGRLRAELHFSEDRIAQQLEDLYARVLEAHGGSEGFTSV